ncbi:MAG: putative GTP-binding protein EngB [Chlamydiae bacterium]|nr:putative GTP-binding protein EngB [Chlamydiota bacterium]
MNYKSRFLTSAASSSQFPELSTAEIAFVGRSNVGKSTLLNHFSQTKKLAHISNKPGKTRLINFFSFGEKLTLVDLPGYGFAKVPKTMREKWGDLVQKYLETRKNLALILLLIDLRMPPTKDDLAFAKWATYFKKRFVIVFTKADKLKTHQQKQQAEKNFALLKEAIGDTPVSHILYSIKDARARTALAKEIEKFLP